MEKHEETVHGSVILSFVTAYSGVIYLYWIYYARIRGAVRLINNCIEHGFFFLFNLYRLAGFWCCIVIVLRRLSKPDLQILVLIIKT